MKLYLKNGNVITVEKKDDLYLITPAKYQIELDYYIENPPVVAGTYISDKINWNLIAEILEVYMFNRQVMSIEDCDFEEMSYEPDVIY